MNDRLDVEEVAVIGASGQFPQSKTLDSFWQNLSLGRELISFFSDQELFEEGIDPGIIKNSNYVRAKGLLEDVLCFDADFFGFSPREAELLDPQQRRLLEWAWAALEIAGYTSEQYNGLIGVFTCSSLSSYFYLNLLPHFYGSTQQSQDEMLMVMGNEKDFLATRISYKMNLRGPSKSIQTACSSSLVAVHDACQSLLNYECDMALAGGVSITFPQKCGYIYSKEGITSPDGHCRAFDHLAAGTLTGNGGGVVVLKRFHDAIADGDTILAVIKGSCVNNDGADKVGYTAPSVRGQANAITTAHLAARIDPRTITYVECHGTGTILGDPVEIKALTTAFAAHTKLEQKHLCALGSVKTNIGHLDAAAGIAGLIKTILALKSKQIPPSLHFEKGNPNIPFGNSPFYVNTKLAPWISNSAPRRAGVSSFGIGGTNAHVVLEEPPLITTTPSKYTSYLVPFSAKNKTRLSEMVSLFISCIDLIPFPLADIAYTLQVGRKAFEERICFICHSKDELIGMISQYLTSGSPPVIPQDSFWSSIANLWSSGKIVTWVSYYQNEKRQRVPLPHYPFAKSQYFIPPKVPVAFSEVSQSKEKKESMNARVTPYVPSRNKMEEHLVMIWQKSLKMQEISIHDDFFNLGGDSLIALEITDRIRHIFHMNVNLQYIFDNPTIALLAAALKHEIAKRVDDFSDEEATLLLELV